MKEPWGSLGAQLSTANFLHDWSKNKLNIEAGISMKIIKGLSFNVSGEYSPVRDQLAVQLFEPAAYLYSHFKEGQTLPFYSFIGRIGLNLSVDDLHDLEEAPR